jgi:DNA-binding PadR family transcriptional regulator
MIFRNTLLGMLARQPRSGYDLSQLFERSLCHLLVGQHGLTYIGE